MRKKIDQKKNSMGVGKEKLGSGRKANTIVSLVDEHGNQFVP
jgi:hypothetical protein